MAHLDIANRLAIYGYKDDLEDFDTILAKTWWASFEATFDSVERLLYSPKEAIRFCKNIRIETALPNLADHEILLRLSNIRKSRFLHASKPKETDGN